MRKLMLFTIGFAMAVLLGIYGWMPGNFLLLALFALILVIGAGIVCLRHARAKIAALLLLGCSFGFVWQAGFDRFYLNPVKSADQIYTELTVTATDYSQPTEYGCAVNGIVRLQGRVYRTKIYLPAETEISPGDQISGAMQLRATLPGSSRDSDYNRGLGIFLITYARGEVDISPVESLPWFGYPAATRRALAQIIDECFTGDTAPFAKALLLGQSEELDYSVDTAFKVTGIRHVVAVSGLHISILFSLIFFLTGKRKRLSCILSLGILLFFAAVAGFTPSITRACLMHGLMSVAFLMRREYDPPTALSFAVLIMLLIDPWTMGHVGFQLSVGCVAGILLFSQRIQDWLLDRRRLGKFTGIGGRVCRWIAVSSAVSVSASVITAPLCALYFDMVSLVGVLTNLLTLWLITYIFYGIVLVCVVGGIYAPVGSALAWIVIVPIRAVIWFAKLLAKFPLAAVYMKNLYMILWLILCYVLLAVFLMARRKRPLLLGLLCATMLCVCVGASWAEPLWDECRVTILDVGQGQCILLQSQGKNFLVDCGGDTPEKAADEAAALLLSQGIDRLDGLILTHFDQDHAGGASLLLSRVSADAIFIPNCPDPDQTRQALLDRADCPVYILQEDAVLRFGDTTLTMIPSASAMTDNESGLCVLFQTKSYDILITGDRSIDGEAELLEHMQLPELELLVVGHHGSRYSTGESLLAATTPEMAVISVSADNHYGHPTQEVLDRLESFGCQIYRTDQDGTILFRG